MKRPLRIVLVRHGESKANVYQEMIDKGEAFGYPPEFAKLRDWDIPLTPKGKAQAKRAGAYLDQHFGKFDACYVSPQKRTIETFDGILDGYKDPKTTKHMRDHARFDSRLREKDAGAINFLSKEEVKQHYPHEFARREREGKVLYRPLGGESWYDVKDLRVGSILNTIYRDHRAQSVLVVSHSVVIKCFRMKLERLSERETLTIMEKQGLDNCGICVFEYGEKSPGHGKLLMKEWNKRV